MTYTLRQDADGLPVLQSARLRLRVPQEDDLSPFVTFWWSERSRFMSGPLPPHTAVVAFREMQDQWRTMGFGLFVMTMNEVEGGIGCAGPLFPMTHPEPELGWFLWDEEFEGQGFAFEAAVATRDWFFAEHGAVSVVSHIDPRNRRSRRLCEKMGAVVDPDALHPYGDEPTVTFRHHARAA